MYTCTTCGQHYFITWLKDYEFTGNQPEGGQLAEGDAFYWEKLDESHNGKRAILVDQVISQNEDEDLEDKSGLYPIYVCRFCGSAHPDEYGKCMSCGSPSDLVKLYAVQSRSNPTGYLTSCISCAARGRSMGSRYREPIRPVRAITVSDVHVIAQDMVHHAERQRLLIFTDNRQDAAFQAGWMKDHARRFRLRRLMAEAMKDRPVSIGDMVMKLDEELDGNDDLSRALIPEVWRVVDKEGAGGAHQEERKYFLRIQVLREITTSANQRYGLEPWGRLKVIYDGIDSGSRFIQTWANKLGIPPDDFRGGIEAFLDQLRRQRFVYDPRSPIYSQYWGEGDKEIQRGYMPTPPGAPQGLKLEGESGDQKKYVRAWLTESNNSFRQIALKWGLSQTEVPVFLKELWNYLTGESLKILIPVTLRGSRGNPLPNASGVYQINSQKLILSQNHGYYCCNRCRRTVSRRTPKDICLAWHCYGQLEYVKKILIIMIFNCWMKVTP